MNLTIEQIVETCHDVGLRIEPFGDRLLVVDEVRREPYVPESLFRLLVEHRDEIRERLRVGHLAKQILYGEFDAATLAKLLTEATQ